MELLIPEWPQLSSRIGAFMTYRSGGVSHGPYDDGRHGGGLNLGLHVNDDPVLVQQNRQLLGDVLPHSPVWLNQVHSAHVVDAASVQGIPDADASVANQPHVVCTIMTADCLPVLFADQAGQVVGAAHAGWRGLANGVLQNTLQAMKDKGAGEISAWLGAAIGPERFEVGQDVFDVFVAKNSDFKQAFTPISDRNEKYWADIYLLARITLQQNAVKHIFGGEHCTVKEKDRFYSYRRDRVTGRMATCIWIK